jgi:hypothetical protein
MSNENPPVTRKSKLRWSQNSNDVNIRAHRRATMGVYLPSSMINPPTRCDAGSFSAAAIRSAGLPTRTPARNVSLPTPSRWRFFPSFLSRDATNNPTPEPHTPGLSSPPRRGDVVCLSYDTLDDRAMRRLEGRSDHRPVIGSYAVYL